MVTPVEKPAGPGRAQQAAVRLLARLLPAGFRARQQAEWSGDLIALAEAGRGGWRYLLAAAWTLPALRASARRAGLDRPHAMVPVSIPVAIVQRVILIGLGWPIVAWLIAVPFRYYLLDVPARIAGAGYPGTVPPPGWQPSSLPFDPKDLWPMDGPLIVLVPLWIVLSLGGWAVIASSLLLIWLGLCTALIGTAKRGISKAGRGATVLVGVTVLVLGNTYVSLAYSLGVPASSLEFADGGLFLAVLGVGAAVFGLTARGLTRRARIATLAIGVAAVAVFAWHHTATGMAMLNWYLD